jgi:hypothetical protein
MIDDDLKLLRDFRKGFPAATDDARRTIYTRATQDHGLGVGLIAGRPRSIRLLLAAALACAAVAATLVGAFRLGAGTTTTATANTTTARGGQSSSILGVGDLPTVAHPLPASLAKETTLAAAPAALGGPVVLPDSAQVGPSDVGPVWVASLTDQQTGDATTTVAVTFPSQGMVVEYTRPAPSDGTASHLQAVASGVPTGQVITLADGTPALTVQPNSDETGKNFGVIIFNVGDTELRVMGHNDLATLRAVAQSILDRSSM